MKVGVATQYHEQCLVYECIFIHKTKTNLTHRQKNLPKFAPTKFILKLKPLQEMQIIEL